MAFESLENIKCTENLQNHQNKAYRMLQFWGGVYAGLPPSCVSRVSRTEWDLSCSAWNEVPRWRDNHIRWSRTLRNDPGSIRDSYNHRAPLISMVYDFMYFGSEMSSELSQNHGFSSKIMDGHQNPLVFYWKLEWDFSGEWNLCVA